MTAQRLRLGRMRTSKASAVDLQIATAVEPSTGRTVVMLRIGDQITTMSPADADRIGDGLKIEAAYARRFDA